MFVPKQARWELRWSRKRLLELESKVATLTRGSHFAHSATSRLRRLELARLVLEGSHRDRDVGALGTELEEARSQLRGAVEAVSESVDSAQLAARANTNTKHERTAGSTHPAPLDREQGFAFPVESEFA